MMQTPRKKSTEVDWISRLSVTSMRQLLVPYLFTIRWRLMAGVLSAFCAGVYIARRYDIEVFRWGLFLIIVGFCMEAALREGARKQ